MEKLRWSKKTWLIIGVILIIVILIGVFGLREEKGEKTDIKIGVIFSLSGRLSTYGNNSFNGVALAVEEINENGGINGKKINLIIEDSKSDSTSAVTSLYSLISKNIEFIIGPEASSLGMAMAPVAEENKTLLFAPTVSAPDFGKISSYTFRIWSTSKLIAKQMAEFTYNKLDIKRVAVLYTQDDRGVGYKINFIKRFVELGGKIVFQESFSTDISDFRTHLIKIKEKKPEALYLLAYSNQYIIILKQIREIDLEIQLLSDIGIEDPQVIKEIGRLTEGIIYNSPGMDYTQERTKKFVEAYKKKHNKEPDTFAAHGYDGTYILLQAIKECDKEGNLTVECVQSILLYESFEGVTGRISFDKNGDVIKEMIFKQIKNGQFVPYEE